MKLSLSTKTLIGMVLGAIIGFIVGPKIEAIGFIGTIFLRALQMAVVPLIFFSVVTAIISMGDVKRLGVIGSKLIVLFMSTTLIAAAIGILVGNVIKPGKGLVLGDLPEVDKVDHAPTFSSVITEMFPTNIIQSMSEGNILQVIVFALFSGVAILLLKEHDRNKIQIMFQTLNNYIMKVLNIVLLLSPYGVFALMAVTAGKYGTSVIGPLTKFIGSIYVGLFLQLLLVYFILYFLFTKKNPFQFFKKISPVWITSFTTCSTKATMPVSIKTSEEELKLPKDVVGLTIPLGASMNMDGNALWFGVVAIFVTQLTGLEMSISEQVIAVLLGVLMTLGSPGIPGGIFVATTIFLTSLNLPIEVIGLLAGIFRIMDMGITTINVVGSVVVAAIVGNKK
ncbi:dicarboxylate/amino acid:cation symporter [Lederbergia wuyishanensis]|uniref:Na+/H+-dicarboxylate symporter n=1 Tax=Lederbergia wuyishanensis TaxID=1347903 RepID=A0ABU0D0E1_9BACI|nr:dicarboxylate/amino acid:cation symporter [Lederbergia wuyishanensis]MCJ8006482.1 dicarboxylate/amino acid:cation symporter [Lederbergia wuyishanensis]MDQ0341858.1 Na+/H+-dicarboxylate symporter [Lederbergia wuyishanensis]